MGPRVWAVAVGACLALACSKQTVFNCVEDGDCRDNGIQGICQDSALCSFPDPECPSDQRYGEFSGSVSGKCVPTEDTGTGEGTSAETNASSLSTSAANGSNASTTVPPLTTGVSASTGGATPLPTGPTGPDPGSGDSGGGSPSAVFWFDFDDPFELLRDVTGNGFDGQCLPCPTGGEGRFGMGARFAASRYFDIPHAEDLVLDRFTITVWVLPNIDAPPGERIDVINKRISSGTSWHIWLTHDVDNDAFDVNAHAGDGNSSAGGLAIAAASADDWTFLAGSYDGELMRLWINGEEVSFAPPNAVEYDTSNVSVGAITYGLAYDDFYFGGMDDLRLYDTALTQAQIAAVQAGGEP